MAFLLIFLCEKVKYKSDANINTKYKYEALSNSIPTHSQN